MSSVDVTQGFINAGTPLQNGTSYVMTANVSMNSPFTFAGDGAGITFDGSGYTVTAPTNWVGLFNKAITVRNLGILSAGKTATNAGWFFATTISGSATNCYSTGTIGSAGGGIFGFRSSGGSATNCYSTGDISLSGGGIFGSSSSSGSATNCYSRGDIGTNGGGIFGSSARSGSSAINCYSTGTIGSSGGGIFGRSSTGTVTTNCYFINGGAWNDTNANNALTGVPGSLTPVWSRDNKTLNTPYILVANPQPFSNNARLSRVVINGILRPASFGSYSYIFNTDASTLPISISTKEVNATISIQSLSGIRDLSGSLTIDPTINTFTIPITVTAYTGDVATYTIVFNKSVPVFIDQTFVNANTTLVINTSYSMIADVSMNSPFTFEDSETGITFDGSGHTVTVVTAPNSWLGLFNKAITVRNLGILSTGTPAGYAGWFFEAIVPGSAINCYSTGAISSNGGGIFGSSSSGGSATNCYSTGAISSYGGGIFGFSSSSGSATNCYSTGTIGLNGGGIYGQSSTGLTTNCYIVNGGLWVDTNANSNLTGIPGSATPVWSRYNNVPNTPYLLVSNLQPPSDDATLLTVAVNGSTLIFSNNSYTYTFDSSASTIPIFLVTRQPHAVIQISNLSGGGDLSGSLSLIRGVNNLTITVTAQMGAPIANYPLTINTPNPQSVPCFPAGSRILTASGYKAVETLSLNELVMTSDGRQVPVKIYGIKMSIATTVTAPYKIPKGVFGVVNDLILSPDHAFQIRKGVWMLPKRAAILSNKVKQVGVGSPIAYYHLECPQYLRDNLITDGNIVESYGGKSKNSYTFNERLQGYTRSAFYETKKLPKA